MKIAICTDSNPNSLSGWHFMDAQNLDEVAQLMISFNYAAFSELKSDYRKSDNVIRLGDFAIFDVDNDPDCNQLTIDDAKEKLKGKKYLIVTSRSHQAKKYKGRNNNEALPEVDRFRIVIPILTPLSPNKNEYRYAMVEMADQLGLLEFVDKKALKDIARFYYRSPKDAIVVKNDLGFIFDNSEIVASAAREKTSEKAMLIEDSSQVELRINRNSYGHDQNEDYPLLINFDAMIRLYLPKVYELVKGESLELNGSYLIGNGFGEGTSKSRKSLSIFEDNGIWLWHDFKTNESGNVIDLMRMAKGFNAFESARYLSGLFNLDLININYAYYEKVIVQALESATNDKSLELAIKASTGANFVKLGSDYISIADKNIPLSTININKLEIINKFKENRSVR